MGVFKRISDIISANLGELTESFEDPELMLKQAIREMDASIVEATNETAKAMASEKRLERELENNRTQAIRWRERAEKAIEAGDDHLAREALTRKQEHDKLASALQDQVDAAQQASGSLRRQLDGMKAKLAEAKRSLATLAARKRAADFRKKMAASAVTASFDDDADAFSKFDRMRDKVEQAEAEAEALVQLQQPPEPNIVDEPLPADESDLDKELEALKRKMGRK